MRDWNVKLIATGLTPLLQAPTSEIVATQVRERIANGEFAQGSTINETTLASALGVSRGPVREALQRLVQEGLITNERNRKLRVPELTATDVRDIYRTREAIEVAALEAIMDAGSTAATGFAAESRAIIERMAECTRLGDAAGIASADLDFHLLVIEKSGSKRLSRAFATLTVETQMCLHELLSLDPSQGQSVELHTAIVKAVKAQDLSAARAAMRRHNEVTLSHYLASSKADSGS